MCCRHGSKYDTVVHKFVQLKLWKRILLFNLIFQVYKCAHKWKMRRGKTLSLNHYTLTLICTESASTFIQSWTLPFKIHFFFCNCVFRNLFCTGVSPDEAWSFEERRSAHWCVWDGSTWGRVVSVARGRVFLFYSLFTVFPSVF